MLYVLNLEKSKQTVSMSTPTKKKKRQMHTCVKAQDQGKTYMFDFDISRNGIIKSGVRSIIIGNSRSFRVGGVDIGGFRSRGNSKYFLLVSNRGGNNKSRKSRNGLSQRISRSKVNGSVLDHSSFKRGVRIIGNRISSIRSRVIRVISKGIGNSRRGISGGSVVGGSGRTDMSVMLIIIRERMQVGLLDEIIFDSGFVEGGFGVSINLPLLINNVLVKNFVFGFFNLNGSDQFKRFVYFLDKAERFCPVIEGSCYLDMIRTRWPVIAKTGLVIV